MKENKEEEEIKSKIIETTKQINEDLSLIPEYKLLTVYNKLSKIINHDDRKYLILRNKFIFIDKTLTGYINLKDFYDILKNNLPLEIDELKLLLCDPALRNKINPNLYQYKPFFDLVRHFKEADLLKMKQDYNQEQNPYIIKLKNEIKNKDIKNVWENVFKNGLKCTKENFNLLIVELKTSYKYHKLEIEYIFDIICKIGEDNIKYETFRDVMRKKNVEDIRVIYFKGLKEFRKKEKDKKEEKEEKLLINYYPNVLDNNTHNENPDANTKYLVIKGENIINKKESNDINEHFILGNIKSKPNENTENINNENIIPKQDIKSISGKIDITESLVIKAIPKNVESESLNKINEVIKENDTIRYKKYYPKVYDIKNDISKEKTYTINNGKSKESKKIEKKNNVENEDELSNIRVKNILSKHEEYRILKLYSSLKSQFNLINRDIQEIFNKKDIQNTKNLSLNDFISILQADLKINFNKDDLSLLLNSLQNKDTQNGLFSYEEFINNIINVSDIYTKRIDALEKLALINFNTYLIEFKQFFKNNNIDINEIFNAFSDDKININLKNFIFLLKSLKYQLDDDSFYNYIFNIVSKHPEKKLLSKKDLYFFINSEIISEEKFIQDGKIDKNFKENLRKFWYKFIPIFNKIKGVQTFIPIFNQINKQKIKFGIKNLADLFSSIYEVNLDGIITKKEFIYSLNILEINNFQSINDLLIYFEDSIVKNGFQLFNFLGIYESFKPKKKNLDTPPSNFKIYPKHPNIIFKNNYGFFTSLDLAKIKVLCSSIHEAILYIKSQSLNDYFIKFDFFHKDFFTPEQLKAIIIDDLNIKKYDLIEIFLSYILENEKQNDYYVIPIKKLIEGQKNNK